MNHYSGFCFLQQDVSYLVCLLLRKRAPAGGGKFDYAPIGGLALGRSLLVACIYHIRFQGAALLLAVFSTTLYEVHLILLASIHIPTITLILLWFRPKYLQPLP
ncbi:AIS_HP2_G0022650.mRNA.1.CDS.1 [Saccharomyces cerevisiae]|nr:AIS_HP2_G0022650.mRNA.1.CDS.1 [Saccharomyces cerevisiae]CAI6548782.1 AIS_HP2_G0022650.mRNA.1.CDS.1 [Saccharomyces cerevisiae]CAI6555174.1 AIS_HP1_G0023630.mRNA.1.CDS.1 [Saccharomyces cerevisiae]CAI6709758.1 AIS_collapsed_G0023980.mRNA.1.CDS.1 [Saccharomyces cerevisiae]